MNRAILLMILAVFLALPATAFGGMLPDTAVGIAEELDTQLANRLDLPETPVKGRSLIVTTPVNLNNLDRTSPLARQLAEEMTTWFVRSGYRVQEIRKGKNILFEPLSGETLLTRRVRLLDEGNVQSALILAGTYIVTTKNVRFSIRLIHAPTNEVLAMSSRTLPVSAEMYELMAEHSGGPGGSGRALSALRPSVGTRLGGGRAMR
jgi:hypothetical protein